MHFPGFFSQRSSFISYFCVSALSDFLQPIARGLVVAALIVVCPLMSLAQAPNISLAPVITTVAGDGTAGFGGDGSLASAAQLNQPQGMAMDRAGNIYFADRANNVVRKIDAASGKITTVAGSGPFGTLDWGLGSYSGDGGPALSAALNTPYSVAVDGAGNLYIADMWNNRIRVVNMQASSITVAGVTIAAGNIDTVAGGGAGCAGQTDSVGDGCPATSAMLYGPFGVALDSAGNFYIADTFNSRIRRVDSSGQITTVAGGVLAYSGDGNPAIGAGLNWPIGVVLDAAGNLYIADSYNNRIRTVNMQATPITVAGVTIAAGNIATVAGSGPVGNGAGGYTGDWGPATSAQLNSPFGVVVDSAGNLFIADSYNDRIRKVDAISGNITTVVGSGRVGEGAGVYNGDGIPATSAQLGPFDLAVDRGGNLYIADGLNNRIRKVSSGTNFGQVPVGTTSTQTIYISFESPDVPIQISSVQAGGDYLLTPVPNINKNPYFCQWPAVPALINEVCGYNVNFTPTTPGQRWSPVVVTYNNSGTTYTRNFGLAGTGVGSALAFTPGIISTVAGGGSGCTGQTDAIGDGCAATSAKLLNPASVAVDGKGTLYIADKTHHLVRKVDTNGIITIVAGTGTGGYNGDNVAATSAELNQPFRLALDSAGNIYIADYSNQRVRKVDAATGIITTVAGSGTDGFSGDNGPAINAKLWGPEGVAVDSAGNFYIADGMNNRIRKVDANGIITTVAGNGTQCSNADVCGDGGPAASAQLDIPRSVAVDSAGNLYIGNDDRIRKVDSSGVITTVAGSAGLGGPAVDSAGNLYAADANNARVYKIDVSGAITPVAGNGVEGLSGDSGPASSAELNHPAALALDNAGNLYIAEFWNHRIRKVDVTTSALSFGTVNQYEAGMQTVEASNVGNLPLNFTRFSMGSPASQYSTDANFGIGPGGGNACSTMQAPLPIGGNCALNVTFSPTQVGNPLLDTVFIYDNAFNSPQSITLTGVSLLPATHFSISAPSSAIAGTQFNFTVTALDQNNNVATGYRGTVRITTSDANGTFNGFSVLTYTFDDVDSGVRTLPATLRTAGNQTITVAQAAFFSTSITIAVSPGRATHFAISGPASVMAGSAFSFTVSAQDQFNNTVTSYDGAYSGQVFFASTDAQAVLPLPYLFSSPGDDGTHTFTATLKTSGNQTITATAPENPPTIAGTSSAIAVSPAAATHFAISAPASATAGTPFNLTVTALDQFNNTATGYAGTVHFTATGPSWTLPPDATLTNGTGSFSATLYAPPAQTIMAKDAANPSLNGTSSSIAVSPGAASEFILVAPASVTAGSAFSFTFLAFDTYGNTATGYRGTVHFTSNNSQAVLPADYTFTEADSGTHTFSATLRTAGAYQQIIATDTGNASIPGWSYYIVVSAAAASRFAVSAPGSATAGTPFSFSVTALDPFNNTATGYSGIVHFSSSDGYAALPANAALANGTGTFTATLNTPGAETITASDTLSPSVTGSSSVSVEATQPVFGAHPNLTAEATSSTGAVVTFSVTAGNQDGPANVTCAPGSGSAFRLGATRVDCTATDPKNSSLISEGSFYVSVRDTTPPALQLSNPIATVASGLAGTTVNYTVTAIDWADSSPTVACTPASGALFPIGVTTVNCTATDHVVVDAIAGNSGGNKTSGTFTVTVSDFSLEPLSSITIPVGASGAAQVNVDSLFGFNSPVALTVTGPAGVLATLSPASVTPAAGGKAGSNLTLQLSPAVVPGALQFTVKGTLGTLTHTATLNVTVNADYSSVNDVIGQITNSGGLDNSGISGTLSTKLSDAQSYIRSGNTKNAKNALNALLNHISAQSGKHILTSCTDKNTGVTYNPVTVLSAEVNVLMLNLSGSPDPIVGSVVNALGVGIPGAVVSISDSSGNIVASPVTDVTGFYFVADTSMLAVGSTYTTVVTGMPPGYTTSTPAQAPFTWQAVTTSISFMLQ